MQAVAKSKPDDRSVLTKGLLNAAYQLGLSPKHVSQVIGKDRTTIKRSGVDPKTKAGELATLIIRCQRSLYALMGGDIENMRHFMNTENRGTGGIPAEQITHVTGLVRVVEYLDGMRGKA